MKRIITISILFLILNVKSLQGQEAAKQEIELERIIREIESEAGNKYELIITLPINYNDDKTYKVLYYLDGWWLSELIKGSYRINYLTNEMEEVILVGLSIKGDEEAWNKQRNKDYTPSIYDKEKMKISMKSGTVELEEETTGGAEEFIRFMKRVIFDKIESTYNIDKETRGILGHSFGGLFGYYCLINHTEIFKNYILISPSIWWNKSEFLTTENIKKIKRDVNIYVVVGKSESKMLITPIREMTDALEEIKNERIRIESKEYEGMDHHSILPTGIYEGIEIIYRKK
jgi:predicted alpha/beta superfamily hydrolase